MIHDKARGVEIVKKILMQGQIDCLIYLSKKIYLSERTDKLIYLSVLIQFTLFEKQYETRYQLF